MSRRRANYEWLRDLNSSGSSQAEAIEDLRKLLLRAALYTFSRHLGGHHSADIFGRAEDCAQDALVSVMAHLTDFRGESKFTTWAYKFGINIALVAARREQWKGISLDQLIEESGSDDWISLDARSSSDPEIPAMQEEVWKVIQEVIRQDLTAKQRLVLKLMVFDQVPMDVVVQRLNTNRNAIYKLLHDARMKIKIHLQRRGFGVQETFALFREEK